MRGVPRGPIPDRKSSFHPERFAADCSDFHDNDYRERRAAMTSATYRSYTDKVGPKSYDILFLASPFKPPFGGEMSLTREVFFLGNWKSF